MTEQENGLLRQPFTRRDLFRSIRDVAKAAATRFISPTPGARALVEASERLLSNPILGRAVARGANVVVEALSTPDPVVEPTKSSVHLGLAKIHIEQAIAAAKKVRGGDSVNALIKVASLARSAKLDTTPVLKALSELKTERTDRHPQDDFVDYGLLRVYGINGNFTEATAIHSGITNYADSIAHAFVDSVEVYAGRGEEIDGILAETIQRLDQIKEPKWQVERRVGAFARMGSALHKIGRDPSPLFARSEQIIDAMIEADEYTGRQCEETASEYALCGMFDKALALLDKIHVSSVPYFGTKYKTPKDTYSTGTIVQMVCQEMIRQGKFDGELQLRTTGKSGDNFKIDALVKKSIYRAEHGEDGTAEAKEAWQIVKGIRYDQYRMKNLPYIGAALVRNGRYAEAKQAFDEVRDYIKRCTADFSQFSLTENGDNIDQAMDRLDVSDVCFEMAKALDIVGDDPREMFKLSVEVLLGWEADFGAMIVGGLGSATNILTEMINRGYLDMAREWVENYPEKEAWGKSELLARLAAKEMKLADPAV